jgi:hypothetical protein
MQLFMMFYTTYLNVMDSLNSKDLNSSYYSPVPIVVGLALVLAFGAFSICMWNGYSGVSATVSIDQWTVKIFCTP